MNTFVAYPPEIYTTVTIPSELVATLPMTLPFFDSKFKNHLLLLKKFLPHKTTYTFIDFMNFTQRFWIKIFSSPLLEFYIRGIFAILQSFDIISINDFPLYKCQKINLALRRHFYRRHDYKVLADKIKNSYAVYIYPTPIFMNFFINYVFALQILYNFIFKPVLYPASSLFHALKLLIYDTYFQIILCMKDLNNNNETKISRTTGGGPSYELNYYNLSEYSSEVKTDMKYLFYKHILESEKSEFFLESTDLIAISNIPLNVILPKLTVENLKLIAKNHKLKTHSKMKSQEIQSIISAHTCDNCPKYIYIFKCIENEDKSAKRKADLLKATKKYQSTSPEKHKATNLESVKKTSSQKS